MSRPLALGGMAVALLLLLAGTAALWFLTGTGAPPPAVPAGGEEVAGPGGAAQRAMAGKSAHSPSSPGAGDAGGRSVGVTGGGGSDAPSAPWVAGPMELRAPTPDQIPCGDLDCLTEDPERYRTEVHGMLAREGLELLLVDSGIEGEEAQRLRAELEANLDAFSRGPEPHGR